VLTFDLYGFGDASEVAYGACLYAVSTDRQGIIYSELICARSKVAPLKTMSLPRLELEAALLLARLYDTVKRSCGDRINKVKLWSDSTITLGWIRTPPHTLKTFVANRVAKIQGLTEEAVWSHVSSKDNPADLLSRGISVDRLMCSQLWWNGPCWLREGKQSSPFRENSEIHLPELRSLSVTLMSTRTQQLLEKYSSYQKLCRIVALCCRFADNCRFGKKTTSLTTIELQKAEKIIIRWVQQEAFATEFQCLQEDKPLPRKSPLRALTAYLSEEGLIRVGGRLQHAELNAEQKNPLVLPAKHHVTSIILRDRHERLLHCPPEQLLHDVRQKFWPISGRREVRKIIKKCIKCYRFHPIPAEVKMGDLPSKRVRGFDRPFTSTGIDYAGPIQVRESRRRGRIYISKGYIAIFVCTSTKVVHLEIVSDLSTDSFVATLRRFIARRGLCSQIISDNGTNFVGASRQLKELYEFLAKEQEVIKSELAEQRIEWRFIPPRAPNFGGLWEAVVKNTKKHLYTITQGRILTYEEYSTLLTQIEAVLNSRPLTPLSSDPSDLSALTPAHFLIGGPLLQPVQSNHCDVQDNSLSRWQRVQKLSQLFWRRWQTEYLQELQKRTKWINSNNKMKKGDLVIMKEENFPPLQWRLGRIVEIHPGRDGEVRVVTLRTSNGVFKRSVRKLCLLPLAADS